MSPLKILQSGKDRLLCEDGMDLPAGLSTENLYHFFEYFGQRAMDRRL